MSNEERTTQAQAVIEQARSRMTTVAAGMVQIMDPVDAAGILIGAAVGILQSHRGAEIAVRYLRDLANEIERSPEGRQHGHA